MSKCCSIFNTSGRGRILQHSMPSLHESSSPCSSAEEGTSCCCTSEASNGVLTPVASDRCSCASSSGSGCTTQCASPMHTMMPVIYDECGINLCRVVAPQTAIPTDAASMEVQVLDVDFRLNQGNNGTYFTTLTNRPGCIRITLTNLDVTFRLTALDCCGNIISQSVETVNYLNPDPYAESSDPDTNPTSVTLDIYVPYGLTYSVGENGSYYPAISYLGPVVGVNSQLEQGLSVQAASKVLRFDTALDQMALGLTLYLRSMYFTEFRIAHQGLAVPPKASPVEEDRTDACQDFVDGALLTPQICPAVN